MKRSAGVLLRRDDGRVLLVHPGGPFWAKKDAGAWSIPKGEHDDDEDPEACARREFLEELGARPRGSDRPRERAPEEPQGGARVLRRGRPRRGRPSSPTRSRWSGRRARAARRSSRRSTARSGSRSRTPARSSTPPRRSSSTDFRRRPRPQLALEELAGRVARQRAVVADEDPRAACRRRGCVAQAARSRRRSMSSPSPGTRPRRAPRPSARRARRRPPPRATPATAWDDVLDLLRVHVQPAGDDHVLLAAGDRHVAVLVDRPRGRRCGASRPANAAAVSSGRP